MPEEGLLRSQAQRAIVADQGANYQPWAQGGLIEYSPAGTATYVPRTYTPSFSNTQNNQNNQNNQQNNQQQWIPPSNVTIDQGLIGGGQTPFMQFTKQAHESLYPGRFGTWGLDAQGNPLGAAPATGAINILTGRPPIQR